MSSFSSANKKVSLLASAYLLALLAQAPTAVNAHMRIQEPAPLRGQNKKFYDWSSFDYSMTNPLLPDGSNYPCKGYQTDVPSKSSATDTLKAGQQYTMKLGGDTLHKGGSCQISLSYDGGKTFGVIHSIIGGCPLTKSYTFPIPSATPAGKNVFLAWSWFNHEGNREMYMNCAAVDVESSATASLRLPAIFQANIFGSECTTIEGQDFVFPNPGDSVEYGGPYAGKKPDPSETSLNNCPGGDRTDGVFVTLVSNTGASSGGESSSEPAKAKPDSESGSEDDKSSDSESAPEPTLVDSSSSVATKVKLTTSRSKATSSREATSTSVTPAVEPTQAPLQPTPSPSDAETEADSQDEETQDEDGSQNENTQDEDSSDADTQEGDNRDDASQDEEVNESVDEADNESEGDAQVGKACSGSGIECSADGLSFYTCSNGALVSMGDVAAGTVCKNGQISLAPVTGADEPAVTCSANALKCSEDGGSFSVCNASGNGYIDMGIVAPGTICKNGQIGFADKRDKRNNVNNTRSAHQHRRQRRGGQPLRMSSH